MIAWKAWFDVRRRFRIALGVAVAAAVATVAAWANLDRVVPYLDLAPEDASELAHAARDYQSWIASAWIDASGGGLLAYLAILVAVGGVLTERRDGTLEVTLSLPVPPARWVLAHAGVVVALTASMAAASGAILVVGGAAIGDTYPIATAAADALRVTITAAGPIGVTLFLAAWTRNVLRTVLLAVPTVFVLHQPVGAIAAPLWGHAALGVIGVALAIALFSRRTA